MSLKIQFYGFVALTLLVAGCASHSVPQEKKEDPITSHISQGVKIYVSKKSQEVRVGLLNQGLNPLTRNSFYLYVQNNGSAPVNVELSNFTIERGGRSIRLRPMQEVIEQQEKLSSDALSDSKWPKIFNGDPFSGGTNPEIKSATASVLGGTAAKVTPSEDAKLDQLASENLTSPQEVKSSEQVVEVHKKLIGSLKANYFQPVTIAPGKNVSGFIKFEPNLAPTQTPIMVKAVLNGENHIITLPVN